MEEANPREYVLCRRKLFFAFRPHPAAFFLSARPGDRRQCRHYRGGAFDRGAGKQKASHLGLPEHAHELTGTDLSSLLPFVDTGKSFGRQTISAP